MEDLMVTAVQFLIVGVVAGKARKWLEDRMPEKKSQLELQREEIDRLFAEAKAQMQNTIK